jgi:hypothetical protein
LLVTPKNATLVTSARTLVGSEHESPKHQAHTSENARSDPRRKDFADDIADDIADDSNAAVAATASMTAKFRVSGSQKPHQGSAHAPACGRPSAGALGAPAALRRERFSFGIAHGTTPTSCRSI